MSTAQSNVRDGLALTDAASDALAGVDGGEVGERDDVRSIDENVTARARELYSRTATELAPWVSDRTAPTALTIAVRTAARGRQRRGELVNCEAVCANCHMWRSAPRAGYYAGRA